MRDDDVPELTQAMLDAGRRALVGHNDDYESAEDAVRRIWEAMHEAAPAE